MDEILGNSNVDRVNGEVANQDKIYWHEAFYEALQLELHKYRDVLIFENERLLSKEALKMDVLIIKKEKDIEIEKNIGKIFKAHNIFEYKSETDYLSVYDYNKVLGYALLYSSFEKVNISDITVSFALSRHPRELLKYLENNRGLKVDSVEDGIYYVIGDIVSVQILEQKKLSSEDSLFLKNLRSDIGSDDAIKIISALEVQEDLSDKSKYLVTLISANRKVFEEVFDMSAVVKDLFLEAAERNGWYKDVEEKRNIDLAVEMLQEDISIEKIAKLTKLSIEAVKELQQSLLDQ